MMHTHTHTFCMLHDASLHSLFSDFFYGFFFYFCLFCTTLQTAHNKLWMNDTVVLFFFVPLTFVSFSLRLQPQFDGGLCNLCIKLIIWNRFFLRIWANGNQIRATREQHVSFEFSCKSVFVWYNENEQLFCVGNFVRHEHTFSAITNCSCCNWHCSKRWINFLAISISILMKSYRNGKYNGNSAGCIN